MCGIVGVYAFNDTGEGWIRQLESATERLVSRGPDFGAVEVDRRHGFGHRRLSIIDTSPAGNQPMHAGDHSIIYNGEIYNFVELRDGLRADGVTFDTRSDTEVLLKLFLSQGEKCLQRINGFFAFAVYDHRTSNLLVARDRIGIKPLYYYKDDNVFAFASEMKALAEFPLPRQLDQASLYQYLQLSYVPAPATMWRGVKKLQPGHLIHVSDGAVDVKSYYQLPFDTKRYFADGDYTQVCDELRRLVEDAVRDRLVADVPLGTFLSGGIDSSIVSALAAKHVDKLRTFSIGYRDDPIFDETRYAETVAKAIGSEHTAFSLSDDDLYAALFDVLEYNDEPFADSSALAVYILSHRTRRHVTVALSGDGADELFAGYNKHLGELRVRHGGVSAALARHSHALVSRLPLSRNTPWGNRLRQIERFGHGAAMPAAERYWAWCSFTRAERAAGLLAGGVAADAPASRDYQQRRDALVAGIRDGGDMNEVLYADVAMVLPDDMLRKVDSMSMANSLEVRVPFLDHRVVEFAFRVPIDMKMRGGVTKSILRDAFGDLLPDEVRTRGKHGFDVPLMRWFRGGLRELIEHDVLDDDFIVAQGVFNVAAVRELKRQLFSARPGDIEPLIWSLVVFQSWWKRYMG